MKMLITGSNGQLGSELKKILKESLLQLQAYPNQEQYYNMVKYNTFQPQEKNHKQNEEGTNHQ